MGSNNNETSKAKAKGTKIVLATESTYTTSALRISSIVMRK